MCVCVCVLRERERERAVSFPRPAYPKIHVSTPSCVRIFRFMIGLFSLVCFVFCLFCFVLFLWMHHQSIKTKKSVKWQFSANVWYIALNSDTGFERDSDRIFDPQLYIRYSKHLLKLYKRIQRLTDEIHQCVCTRLATVPSAIQLVSLLEAAIAIVADGTVLSLVQTHSDEFRPKVFEFACKASANVYNSGNRFGDRKYDRNHARNWCRSSERYITRLPIFLP